LEKWNGKKDLLNRKNEAEFLTTYLLKRYENTPEKPFVLNVNAEWGFGKTFFLENLAEDLKNKDYPVLYFDAWKNDYTNEPLISFISEMDSLLTPFFSKDDEIKRSFKNVLKSSKSLILPVLIKKFTGHSLDELEDKIEEEPEPKTGNTTQGEISPDDANKELKDEITSVISKAATLALTEHQTIKDSISSFKTNMKVLLKSIESKEGINLPMFVFIDELDRCRPNYAIELLENIKHIFDIPGITFIIATDSKQLSHSINAVYGNDFASERYLKRFFDQEYTLTAPDSYLFAEYLFEIHNIKDKRRIFSPLTLSAYEGGMNMNIKLFSLYADYFKLSYRDQEQVITSLSAICLVWDNDKSIHLGYILFLLIMKHRNSDLFKEFLEESINNKKAFIQNNKERFDVNESIMFKYIHNGETKEYSMSHIIENYLKWIDADVENIYSNFSDSIGFIHVIVKQIRSELPSSYNSYHPPKYNFDIYTDLVLRTGQFS